MYEAVLSQIKKTSQNSIDIWIGMLGCKGKHYSSYQGNGKASA